MNTFISLDSQLNKLSREIFDQLEKNWSAQVHVSDILTRSKVSQILSLELEPDFFISKKEIRKLSSSQKISLYFLTYFLEDNIDEKSPKILNLWISDVRELLLADLRQVTIISVFVTLNRTAQEKFLWHWILQERNSRYFFSAISGRNIAKIGKDSVIERISDSSLCIKFRLLKTRKPRKPQFRKGYRDHGSLGSDISKIRKEESNDVWLQLKILRKKKDQEKKQLLTFMNNYWHLK